MDNRTLADLSPSSPRFAPRYPLLTLQRLALALLLLGQLQSNTSAIDSASPATNSASPYEVTPQQSSQNTTQQANQFDEALRRGSNPVWADALEEDVTLGRALRKDIDVSDRHIDIQSENNTSLNLETSNRSANTTGTDFGGDFLLFLFRMLVIVAGLALLGTLIYMLLASPAAVKRRRRSANEVAENIVAQKAKLSDLPFEVEQPIAGLKAQADYYRNKQDYRNAMIYLFSYLLVECDTAGCIRLARGKTNHRYVRELKGYPEVQNPFKRVVELFEEAFFGRKEISKERFEAIWNELPVIEQAIAKTSDTSNHASNKTSNKAGNKASNQAGNDHNNRMGGTKTKASNLDTEDSKDSEDSGKSTGSEKSNAPEEFEGANNQPVGVSGKTVLILGLASVIGCSSAGCRQSVNAVYGESDSYVGECSPSGITVFREMAELKGHRTQVLGSISPSMNQTIQTIVWIPDKFPQHRPDVLAALQQWLDTGGKTLVYVGRDASPQAQYWSEVAKNKRLRVDDEQRILAVRSAAEETLQLDLKRDAARDLSVTPWFYARKQIGPVKPITSFTGEWADVLAGQPTRIVARTELRPYRTSQNTAFGTSTQPLASGATKEDNASDKTLNDSTIAEADSRGNTDGRGHTDGPGNTVENHNADNQAQVLGREWETIESIREELGWKSEGRTERVKSAWLKAGVTPPIGGMSGEEYLREFLPIDQEQLEIATGGQAGRGGRVSELLMGSRAEALVVQIDQEHTLSKVLVVANGSIVSNVGMLGVGQRRIAERIIDRFSAGGVGFISGSGDPLLRSGGSELEVQRGFEMLTVWPLNVLTIHGAVAAMVAILAFSPIFGRPKRLRGSSTADFGEHVQAVGELIRGTGDVQYAKRTIAKYFRVVRGDSVSPWSTLDQSHPTPTQVEPRNRPSDLNDNAQSAR